MSSSERQNKPKQPIHPKMASISFAAKPPKPSNTEASTPEVSYPSNIDKAEVSLAVAPKIEKSVVAAPTVAAGVVGEVSMSDIKLPRLNLVQKVGSLADSFHPGSIVFEKAFVLSDGKPENALDLTPLQFRKQYQRKTVWGEGDNNEQPEVYDTAEQVRAAGGSLQYGDENYFQEIAHIAFAVKLPENLDAGDELIDLFQYKFADALYTVAMWTVASSSYTALGKRILTDSAMALRNGLHTGHYHVSSEIKKNARNSWYAPKAAFAGKHTPEAATFFSSIING
jgi:hypothetical protein